MRDQKLTLSLQPSGDDAESEYKKPRHSERLGSQNQTTPIKKNSQLPSPLTHKESTNSAEEWKEGTATPPEGRPSQIHHHRTPLASPPSQRFFSPPNDTQVLSQFPYSQAKGETWEVDNEEEEGVWGYLIPLNKSLGDTLVLKKRSACPMSSAQNNLGKGSKKQSGKPDSPEELIKQEEQYEARKSNDSPAGGYLIGRHPECGKLFRVQQR